MWKALSPRSYRTLTLVLLLALAVVLVVSLGDAVAKDKDKPKVPKALNATAARKAQLDAQKETTAKLDELIRLLKSGQVRVVVEKPTAANAIEK